ncbi:NAD(P)/FAD-dependent oxidoreductase [Limnobacter humi]|uniref:NAD(P)/FAD-dependent oxidoreductase n=1 Tax=Limnobacter humi TaxID=1778671 RepID=A0ABT1WJM3_9BURK|nr:NAD(P)/FAD-dependent oxidoreductase [Limnobacter humi]MCQ8897720.1 NAD(P)/FAD-dependent oxidoreductase [Limnobacter humi]
MSNTNPILEVAIVGCGVSGLGMGIRLKQAGIENFRIIDKGQDVGGTWRDNTYPGCGCDVKSALYSYSFEPWAEWSHVYAKQGEIYKYLRHCASKYGIYPHIQFNTSVTGAQYDENTGLWTVGLSNGETIRAKNVVTAVGPFSAPKVAEFKGASAFKGTVVHTAAWDHSVSLEGKRVGLIGTGATAVQVGPAIADQVKNLVVFQRTANWIMPRPDREIGENEKQTYRQSKLAMKKDRLGVYWYNELTAPFLILKYDLFKQQPEKLALSYLRKKVKDPDLRKKLTPTIKFGCKRVLVSSDWYTTMQKPNVHLETTGIDCITEKGIRLADGTEHELDVIIYATGYEVRHTGSPIDAKGVGGASLNEKWKDGSEAYQGVATAGFPNLFFLVGPFTGPGHTSVIAYAESQIDYVIQAIQLRNARSLKAIAVKPAVERKFVGVMDNRSEHTVWKSGCASWYLSPNGRNNTLYPGLNAEYRLRMARFNPSDYELIHASGKTVKPKVSDHIKTGVAALRSI